MVSQARELSSNRSCQQSVVEDMGYSK
jgi:hypothetical protein